MVEWVWNAYRAIRALVLFVVAVLRALLAALILTEDLWIHARSWVLLQLAEREARRTAAAVRVVATGPAADSTGAVTGRVVTLAELRRARAHRQEPA
jgi:hypothetical protein